MFKILLLYFLLITVNSFACSVPVFRYALECSCAWADLSKVRKEISEILPNTKVLESQSKEILFLFLAKAAIIGFVGALIGSLTGCFIGFFFAEHFAFLKSETILLIIFYSVLLSVAAAFIPAISATRQDPAEILRNE